MFKRKPTPAPAPAAEVATPYGYECPCGERLESATSSELLRAAWAHAHGCDHEAHVEARAADATYGHPDHFHCEVA